MGSRVLLLDIGGVLLRSGHEMIGLLAERQPSVRAVAARRGALGSERDEQWELMLARKITEREYWRRRAVEIGRALGQDWDTADLMTALYETQADQLLRSEALALIADAKAEGLTVGALTNDLAAFHGEHWVAGLSILDEFDVLVDGSVTGVLKPDPGAYRIAIERLGRPPEEIVFLDDMPWNVQGARLAGMIAVQVDLVHPAAAFDTARELLELERQAA